MTERPLLRLGFRARVLGFLAALLAASIGVGLVIQRAVLLQRVEREVAISLDQEREELERLAGGRNPATGQPFEGDVRAIFDTFLRRNVPSDGEFYLTFVDGQPYDDSISGNAVRLDRDRILAANWAVLTAGGRGRMQTSVGPIHYLAVPLQSQGRTAGVFVVANTLRAQREQVEAGIRVSAVVAGAVLIVSIGAAWIIAGRLLRPVRAVTDSARSITETDLSRRIPVEGKDEIAVLARTFNEMLDRLASAFSSQRAFIDDAGHELRTPITIVRGHLELMGDEPEEREETVALVTDELDRMARIVDDLLLLAKAEQPDFIRVETFDLGDFTTDLLLKASALGERDWRLDARGAGEVSADAQRLAQAVLNLVRNAVEHTKAGGEIGVGSGRDDGEVRIWVRDSGPGIAAGERERIFERLARGWDGPRRSEGAGLGLAIVRVVAEGHDGRVELESRPGAGATFTVVLPGADPTASSPSETDATRELRIPERT